MKPTYFLFAMAILLALTANKNPNETKWEHTKDDKGVTVYTREVNGSTLKEFRAVTKLNMNIEQVLKILNNFTEYPKWVHNYQDTKLLEKINENECVFYTVIKAPWPVQNRDVALHYLQQKTEYGYKVLIKANNDILQENKGMVRMTYYEGLWELHDKGGSHTEIISQVHADPSGAIPSWLSNSIMIDGPINTLSALQSMAK